MTTNKTAARILNRIAAHSGVTSVGLVAADLKLSPRTVRRHVDALIAAGRVGIGWDGCALELSETEQRDRALGVVA